MDTYAGSKRPYYGWSESGGGNKKFKYRLGACTIHIGIPDLAVSGIIGKSGANVSKLERENGVKIGIEQAANVYAGVALRKITLTGDSYSSLTAAQRQISQTVHDFKNTGDMHPKGEFVCRLFIPGDLVSLLIGKKGAGINQIVSSSGGAYVSFCKREEMPFNHTDRVLTLAGTLDQVCTAQEYCSELLSKAAQNFLSPHQSQPAPSPYQQSQATSFMQDPSMQTYSGDPAALGVGLGAGLDPNYSGLDLVKQFMTGGPSSGGDQMGVQLPVDTTFASSSMNLMHQQQPAMPGTTSKFHKDWRDDEIETMMYVPNRIVGVIIGRKGANIKEVTNQCQNRVYISVLTEAECLLEPFLSPERMRPILLKGPAEYVFFAQYLLQMKMHQNSLIHVKWTIAAIEKPEQVTAAGGGPEVQTEPVVG